MLLSSESIVLQSFKYSESNLIVHLFIQKLGRVSCMVNGIGSKKSKNKAVFFQPFTLLEFEIDYRSNRELQKIKDIRIIDPIHAIRANIVKNTMTIFLGEVLSKTLKEEGEFNALYSFIKTSILYLDHQTEQYSNFHLLFLMGLWKHLGIAPNNNFSSENTYFDISKGRYISFENNFTINAHTSKAISLLLQSSYDTAHQIVIHKGARTQVLDAIVLYYSYHIANFGTVKSYAVLKDLFE